MARPFHALRPADERPGATRLVGRCETKNERYSCASWCDGFSRRRRRPPGTSCSNARGCGSSKSRDAPRWTRPRRIQPSPGRLTPLLENVPCGSGGTGPLSALSRFVDRTREPKQRSITLRAWRAPSSAAGSRRTAVSAGCARRPGDWQHRGGGRRCAGSGLSGGARRSGRRAWCPSASARDPK